LLDVYLLIIIYDEAILELGEVLGLFAGFEYILD
jgi:hypothetical protein